MNRRNTILVWILLVVTCGLLVVKRIRTAMRAEKKDKAVAIFDYKNQSDEFWKEKLKPAVHNICRLQGTERAFSGDYDAFYKKGVYCCACCGGDFPLYSSEAKYDSKTGWPSFWEPIDAQSVSYREDKGFLDYFIGPRTEVVCGRCDSHLGHVFSDGPQEKTGQRHCINSLALVFVPEGQQPKRTFSIDGEVVERQEALFAMGCFWCGEAAFRDAKTNNLLPGILSVRVGYAGGTQLDPTYQNHQGYKEAVKIVFDPSVISYDDVLKIFWRNIDPLDDRGQFCDKGFSYTSAVYTKNDAQKAKVLASKNSIEQALGASVVTKIVPATTFYDAEDYHQNYKAKNPIRYKVYTWNCGRAQRLKSLWK